MLELFPHLPLHPLRPYPHALHPRAPRSDCWEQKSPPRDPVTDELRADPVRFPHGMAALGAYVTAANVSFAVYSAANTETCGGYPASLGHEALDAATFASWNVSYLKFDGCAPSTNGYATAYKAMGAALEATGRDIVYSCSWPAYINQPHEDQQPFGEFIMIGCNLWRNYECVQRARRRAQIRVK